MVVTEGKIWLAVIYLKSLHFLWAPICLCVGKVLCCLLIDVATVALRSALPGRLLILAQELPLIQTTSVAPREFVSAVLIVFLHKYAYLQVILLAFLFDQENATIVCNGQITKSVCWPVFVRLYF